MQFFAVIPAAGESRRMGRDKLLLPWGDGVLIEATLAAWRRSRVTRIIVTVRQDRRELADICRRAGADIALAASTPPDMKASVAIALDHIAKHFSPGPDDAWLLAPADMPKLSAPVIDALVGSHERGIAIGGKCSILAPIASGRRGHPILFPWPLAASVPTIVDGRGIDSLVEEYGEETVDAESLLTGSDAFDDVDTPIDYEALANNRSPPLRREALPSKPSCPLPAAGRDGEGAF